MATYETVNLFLLSLVHELSNSNCIFRAIFLGLCEAAHSFRHRYPTAFLKQSNINMLRDPFELLKSNEIIRYTKTLIQFAMAGKDLIDFG